MALGVFVGASFWAAPALIALVAVPALARLATAGMIQRRVQAHRDRIELAVPGFVDSVIVALEAGSPFEVAVRMYSDASRSDLSDELRASVRSLEIGYRRREVLEQLAARTASDHLLQLSRTVTLADDLGTPLAGALRSLVSDARAQRRQRLQEAALRAPITMLLPTAGLILMPIFAIILGPVAIRIFSGRLL